VQDEIGRKRETRRSSGLTQRGEGPETIILPHNRAPDEFTSQEIMLSSARLITLIRNDLMSLLHLHSHFYTFGITSISLVFFVCKSSAKSPPDDRYSHLGL